MDANQDVEEEVHRVEVILLVYIAISSLILAISYCFNSKGSSEEGSEISENIAAEEIPTNLEELTLERSSYDSNEGNDDPQTTTTSEEPFIPVLDDVAEITHESIVVDMTTAVIESTDHTTDPTTELSAIEEEPLLEEPSQICNFDSIYEDKDMIVNLSDISTNILTIPSQLPPSSTSTQRPFIYCSHDAKDPQFHHKVIEVTKFLRKLGYIIYVDDTSDSEEGEVEEEEVSPNTNDELKEEILLSLLQQSSCILLFLTSSYQTNVNSTNVFNSIRFEFIQSFKQHKPIIPILLDPLLSDRNETWFNRFGIYLDDFPVLPLTSIDSNHFETISIYQKKWKYLHDLIQNMIQLEAAEEIDYNKSLLTASESEVDLSTVSLDITRGQIKSSSVKRKRDHGRLLVKKAAEKILAIPQYCVTHPEEIVQYYDTDCQVLLCAKCSSEHEGHTMIEEKDYQQQKRQPSSMSLPEASEEDRRSLSSYINKVTTLEENSNNYIEKLQEEKKLIQKNIQTQFQQMIEQLKQKEEDILKEMNVFYNKKEKYYYQQLDIYSEQKQSYYQLLQEIQLHESYHINTFHHLYLSQQCQLQATTAKTLLNALNYRFNTEVELETNKDHPSTPIYANDVKTLSTLITRLGRRELSHTSRIIQTISDEQTLSHWICNSRKLSSPSLLSFQLLFSTEKYGWELSSFHEKCDNQGSTLLVIETIEGYVFGAYTTIPFTSPETAEYSTDITASSFLYSLKNPHHTSAQRMVVMVDKATEALVVGKEYGPTYGSGNDMYMINTLKDVFFQSFQSYEENTAYKELLFTNSYTAKVKCMEVWKVSEVIDQVEDKVEEGVTEEIKSPEVKASIEMKEEIEEKEKEENGIDVNKELNKEEGDIVVI